MISGEVGLDILRHHLSVMQHQLPLPIVQALQVQTVDRRRLLNRGKGGNARKTVKEPPILGRFE